MTDQTSITDNIARHLPEVARQQPDAPAVIVQRWRGRGVYRTISCRELDRASNRVANGLIRAGFGRGMRTVVMVPPGEAFFTLTFGLFKAGIVPVMVDPGMGLKNLKTCLAEAEPEAFIGIPKAHAARVVLGWGRGSIRRLVTVGPRLGWGGLKLQALTRRAPDVFDAIEPAPGETAAILFTSGSTGVPKGAVYTHENFNTQVESLRRDYGIVPGEKDIATFPLFALFGPALGMAAIVPDMDATKPGRANPRRIVAAIRDHQATNMFGSPALLDVVGRHVEAQAIKLPSLRRVVSAGAPALPDSLARLQSALADGIEIWPSYGATEALPVARIGTQELLGDTAKQTEGGAGVCVGRPVSCAEVRVIGITDDAIGEWSEDLCLPPGEIGEIVVRGPMVTRAYFSRPESTALAKILCPGSDAFYHRMGDVGYFDGQGRLWMCGRKSHRVELNDTTLFTISCERVFNTHPAVRRSALVGVPRADSVEPVLCVELERGVRDPRHLIRKELMALGRRNPLTERIKTILFHKKFPVDIRHNAKIFREQLREWAARELG